MRLGNSGTARENGSADIRRPKARRSLHCTDLPMGLRRRTSDAYGVLARRAFPRGFRRTLVNSLSSTEQSIARISQPRENIPVLVEFSIERRAVNHDVRMSFSKPTYTHRRGNDTE